MRIKLNGWQRIGVVLTLIWIVSVCAYSAFEYAQKGVGTRYFVEMVAAQTVPIEKRGSEKGQLSTFEDFSPTPRIVIGRVFVAIIVPLVVAWLFVYLCLFTVRWIAKGFAMDGGYPIASGAQRAADAGSEPSKNIKSANAGLVKQRWYEGTRNTIGLAVLSLSIYAWVLMKALVGDTLRGNEVVYVVLWTCIVFYAMWKQRGWKGWVGGLLGFVVGLVVIVVVTVVAGISR